MNSTSSEHISLYCLHIKIYNWVGTAKNMTMTKADFAIETKNNVYKELIKLDLPRQLALMASVEY